MSIERIEELMEQAYSLPDGAAKLAILEEAVREADRLNEPYIGYDIRMDLIHTAVFSGYSEKALVAFSWCRSQFDKDPEEHDPYDLLWKYKWILDAITEFPQVSREQIMGLQDDFEKRLQTLGYSIRPAHYLRWVNLMRMGNLEEAAEYVKKWKSTKRDYLADCRACECNKHMEYLVRAGDDQAALKEGKPVLEGKLSCAEIPHYSYGEILPSLIRLNRLDLAEEYHNKGYRMVSKNRDFIDVLPFHILYLVHIQDTTKALRLIQKHLPWTIGSTNMYGVYLNYVAAMLLFEQLEQKGDKTRKLKLPPELGCSKEEGSYKPSELAAWFRGEVAKIEERFNKRNGNDYYSQQTQMFRALAPTTAEEAE